MKIKFILILLGLILSFSGLSFAETKMKIAIVDMNRAINLSNEGKRSKKLLEAQFAQTQKALQAKEKALIEKEKELQTMIMMTPELRQKKEQQLIKLRDELRRNLNQAQQSFRSDEARHTGKIFKELAEVVKKISKKKKFNLVLESRISQAILYSSYDRVDITDEVIKKYNKLQSKK